MYQFKFTQKMLLLAAAILLSTFGLALKSEEKLQTGADRETAYLPKIKNKRVAIVANQTSVRLPSRQHLVDFLYGQKIDIKKIFAPEHGFRGNHSAGAKVNDDVDEKTGIPVISIYGNNKKPSVEQLRDVDIIVFDIQDVGARFYTYISTLHYVMQAAAENDIDVLVLDRPNPHGNYIDGPILEPQHRSFVGMHEIPVVHGMTIGEYACMINEEGWLGNDLKCDLQVVEMKNWRREDGYSLPIAPSPNLPNDTAIALYPSLCFFEGSPISVGRGTSHPFQCFGHPKFDNQLGFSFKPKSIDGVAKYPKHENEQCFGKDLRKTTQQIKNIQELNLDYLIWAYNHYPDKENFFTPFFTKLAGTETLQKQISSGMSKKEIKESWKEGLENFQQIRKKYLIYP